MCSPSRGGAAPGAAGVADRFTGTPASFIERPLASRASTTMSMAATWGWASAWATSLTGEQGTRWASSRVTQSAVGRVAKIADNSPISRSRCAMRPVTSA